MASTSINNDQKVNKKSCKKHEVQAYLINTNNNNDLSPLEWWQVNGGKYWYVARVAWKCLAVLENSTPSERVFSMCGLVEEISKKLTSLSGSMILRYPEAFFKIPKFDQVMNHQKTAQIGSYVLIRKIYNPPKQKPN